MTHVLGNCGSAEADVMTKLENYPSCVVKTAKTGPGAGLEDVCHSVPGCGSLGTCWCYLLFAVIASSLGVKSFDRQSLLTCLPGGGVVTYKNPAWLALYQAVGGGGAKIVSKLISL